MIMEESITEKELLEITLESIGDAVITTDIYGRIQRMNHVAETLTGWNRQEAMGKALEQVFVTIERNSSRFVEGPFRQTLEQGLTVGLKKDTILLARDGTRRFASASSSPIRDKSGSIIGLVLVFRDVSRLRKYEDELQRRSLIIEQNNSSIVIFDLDERVVYANPQFCRFIGMSREMIGNLKIRELGFPELYKNLRDIMKDIVEAREPWLGEVKYKGPNNENQWISVQFSPIIDEYGHVTSYYMIAQDISDKKLNEEKLIEAKEEAEKASQVKAEFLANMSHEIRTPLNGIIGMTALTLMTDLTEEQRENMSLIKMSGDLLLSLVNNILDFSKLEAGKMTTDEALFDLSELIVKSMSLNPVEAKEKGLLFSSFIDPKIPRKLMGDSHKIQQVLANLIGNAIKFTPSGEISVQAVIDQRMESGFIIKISVSDTGIGIPREHQGKLFQSFSQVDGSITRTYGGTGLGLYITKQLVELMDGTIWCTSETGVGSTFTFTIKLGMPGYIAAAREKESGLDQFRGKTAKTLRILVAEDQVTNQILVTRLMNNRGHEVVLANNGLEVLEIWRADRNFDMILMDIMMPKMDGMEATRVIRAEEKPGEHIPIVAVTAYASISDRDKFLAVGMDEYMAKPVKVEQLMRFVESIGESRIADAANSLVPAAEKGRSYDYKTEMGRNLRLLEGAFSSSDRPSMERYANVIKEYAGEMNHQALKSLAFKTLLAARKGDLDKTGHMIGMLRQTWNEADI